MPIYFKAGARRFSPILDVPSTERGFRSFAARHVKGEGLHPRIETVGGITVDRKAQVVTLGGKPVANGLYAPGAVAFGEHFGRGYAELRRARVRSAFVLRGSPSASTSGRRSKANAV